MNVFQDQEFAKSREVLSANKKEVVVQNAKGNHPQAAHEIKMNFFALANLVTTILKLYNEPYGGFSHSISVFVPGTRVGDWSGEMLSCVKTKQTAASFWFGKQKEDQFSQRLKKEDIEEMVRSKERKSPQILVKGQILNSPEVFPIAENLVVCQVDGGLVEGVLAFMAMNYAFMFKYPAFLNNFCLFIQKHILKIQDGAKLPSTVINFINDLNVLKSAWDIRQYCFILYIDRSLCYILLCE